jgi:hypothetical protein
MDISVVKRKGSPGRKQTWWMLSGTRQGFSSPGEQPRTDYTIKGLEQIMLEPLYGI